MILADARPLCGTNSRRDRRVPKLDVVDLFAGAGGMDEGLLKAIHTLGLQLRNHVVINHWPIAIQTQQRNHPHVRSLCTGLEAVDPRVVVPGGHLHLLIAAPECTHHSTARGGRPMNDQSRASAWLVLRWIELLKIDHLLLENVPEFRSWGPLDAKGRPIKSRKGELYRAFVGALEAFGYRVEDRLLNAADYGEATTRTRLFLQARRGRGPIVWPEPTHAQQAGHSLIRQTHAWRPARDVIDWSIQSQSIFARKKPLATATMRRIFEGLRRFGGPELQPFVVAYHAERHGQGARVHGVDGPLPTVTTENRFGLAEPFLVPFWGERQGQEPRTHDLRHPLPTIPATAAKFGLVEPFLIGQQSGSVPRPVSPPAPTVSTDGAIALVEPYLAKYYGTGGVTPVSQPVPTVATKDRFGLVEPIVIDGRMLDIRFRMLQPHELARAMGFPDGYDFAGNKGDAVKQIGNAVSVRTAEALCTAILERYADRQSKDWREEHTA